MTVFQLGGAPVVEGRSDVVRDGAMEFLSRRGLNTATGFLIDALPKRAPGRALFGMDTEGAAAMAGRSLWPDAAIEWTHVDAYVAHKVGSGLAFNGVDDVPAHEAADLPQGHDREAQLVDQREAKLDVGPGQIRAEELAVVPAAQLVQAAEAVAVLAVSDVDDRAEA